MKFKIILLALLTSLNLSAFEPLMPGKATKKASKKLEQVDNRF